MLLPFLAWSLSGIFFLVRPAYEAAYAPLPLRTYPSDALMIQADPKWQELRSIKSVLGQHLLVREEGVWRQVDPGTFAPRPEPSQAQLRSLVRDAIAMNPTRYGELLTEHSDPFRTTTGATVSVNWDSLSLYQQGADTRWIDRVYSIHYLQWTGIALLDSVLGVLGLLFLLLLTASGMAMLFRRTE